MAKYEARIYYTTYLPVEVDAESEEEAIEKAREIAFWETIPYDGGEDSGVWELLANLEPIRQCDEAY